MPAGHVNAPVMTLNQQAAAGAGSVLGCARCGVGGYSGPTLGDIDPATFPTWAKVLGVFAFVGAIVGIANFAARK
jgi:hypothetical protein